MGFFIKNKWKKNVTNGINQKAIEKSFTARSFLLLLLLHFLVGPYFIQYVCSPVMLMSHQYFGGCPDSLEVFGFLFFGIFVSRLSSILFTSLHARLLILTHLMISWISQMLRMFSLQILYRIASDAPSLRGSSSFSSSSSSRSMFCIFYPVCLFSYDVVKFLRQYFAGRPGVVLGRCLVMLVSVA